MPLYFAYGANLDVAAMAGRCPGARPLGPARLPGHAFFVMADGYASVRPEARGTVHGLLWRLAPADVAPLDAFEEVGRGLYAKTIRPVLRAVGSARAFLYVGHTAMEGAPRPGYMAAVIAGARAAGLPAPYLAELARWDRPGGRGDPFGPAAPAAGPVPGVRPRFRSPLERG